jgi:hypothetical protein
MMVVATVMAATMARNNQGWCLRYTVCRDEDGESKKANTHEARKETNETKKMPPHKADAGLRVCDDMQARQGCDRDEICDSGVAVIAGDRREADEMGESSVRDLRNEQLLGMDSAAALQGKGWAGLDWLAD